MPRAIDHLVIPAHDLAAQAELYRRLGFQVGSRNRHPWGTENHIVQFDGAFLELIGLGEGFEPPQRRSGEFSFAGFVAQYLEKREGLAMLVLRSDDAEADRREFARQGLGEFERFYFARKARRPNGETVDVAFSLAFAASPALPETGFFVCQQHYPLNFWSRAAQVHPNGALGVRTLTFAHPAPEEAAPFLRRFLESPSVPSRAAWPSRRTMRRLIASRPRARPTRPARPVWSRYASKSPTSTGPSRRSGKGRYLTRGAIGNCLSRLATPWARGLPSRRTKSPLKTFWGDRFRALGVSSD